MPGVPSEWLARNSRWALLLSQKLFPSPGVPSDGGWALLLPSFVLGDRGGRHLPCVKGEGEVGASSEGEGENQSLACQVLAEVKALGGQGGVLSNYRSSHFGELLLKYEIELWYQLNRQFSLCQKKNLDFGYYLRRTFLWQYKASCKISNL